MELPDPEPGEMEVYDAQEGFEPFTVTLPGQLLSHLLELKARYEDELAREAAGESEAHTGTGGTSLLVVELVEEILADLARQGREL
jgi:hypothetical protein